MVAVILPWRQRESCCSVEEEGEATRAVRTHHLAVSARLDLRDPRPRWPSPLLLVKKNSWWSKLKAGWVCRSSPRNPSEPS